MFKPRRLWSQLWGLQGMYLCFFLHSQATGSSYPNHGHIPIGTLFNMDAEPVSRSALMYAISTNNELRKGGKGITFNMLSDDVDIDSNFAVTSKLCAQMSSGIFVMYGSTSQSTFKTLQAYSAKFNMPFITPDLSGTIHKEHQPQMLFAKPVYADAIVDLVKGLNWRRLDYVYDNSEGLLRVQHVYDRLKREQYGIEIGFRRIEQVESAHEDLRRLDYLDREKMRNIVLDLSSLNAYAALLRQIPEVGMNRHGYNYILGTLDMLSLDVSRFLHGGVKVYGFQLVDVSRRQVQTFLEEWQELEPGIWPGAGTNLLQTDAALSVDMLHTIRAALTAMIKEQRDVFHYVFRRGKMYNMNKTIGIQCNSNPPLPWMHGEQIYRALKQVDFDGLTGHIQFDEFGQRANYSLDIITAGLDTGLAKIGKWHSRYGLLDNDQDLPVDPIYPQQNYTEWRKVVTTILEPPFLMLRGNVEEDGSPLIGNGRYEGYAKDLAMEIEKRLDIDYILDPVTDGEYGREVENGSWTGMIGQLVSGKADLAIGPLTITAARERVVDFTKPFMDIGISIMTLKPERQKAGLFSFMEPFSLSLWVSIVIAYVTISLTIFIVSRFSPYEMKEHAPYLDHFRYNFTLCNSFWFAMGALMLQGSDLCPRSIAGRIIGGVWWFFVLIIISSYTANLAAFLTVERMLQPVQSADDLVKQAEISYGILETGATRVFFEESNVTTYKMMWSYMSSASPPVMVSSLQQGVHRVQNSGGKYVFLLESSTNEYINNRLPCNTVKVGPNLNLEGFGIATPHGSDLKESVNYVTLKLKEDGTLHKMKQTWWEEKGECGVDTGNKESKKRSLSLNNVAGVFLLLIAGLVVAIGTGLIEAHYIKTQYLKYVSTLDSRCLQHEYSNGNGILNKYIQS
ncbi:glutamate receptor subunit protein GluR5 precursor [Aplysia californica]|uniref:Glutamate receptor subunit protein GluR5 n=1 Tax=Aplysia californica TaxID=6500 RepID=Q7Z1H5_APLCA|nr:glutamate receptor subunit protein GluR5 precursor [Aplysia californica]AAP41207.1 glutamate receptor subunit protein GluR5 [Aplysia californica]